MDNGSVYRRCGCRDENTGRLLGPRCPGLRSPEHGSWYFSTDLPSVYDAAYVALAEKLNVTLVTCDEKFARSIGVGCRIESIS